VRPTIWAILGVERGADRSEIRRAYAKQLRGLNPEDDPDGFKALREAYEAALRHADGLAWVSMEDLVDAAAEWPGEAGWTTADGEDFRPGAEEDAEPALSAEDERLEVLLQRFGDLLGDPDGFAPGDASALLEEILDALHTVAIGAAERAERAIAFHLAGAIPRSDCLIERAAAFFDWTDRDVVAASRDWAVDEILWRMEEWRYIDWAANPEGPMNAGWRALTDPPAPAWRMQLEALSTARANQADSILATAEAQMPHLVHAFEPARLEWWQGWLSRARMNFDTLLLAPALLALLMPMPFFERLSAPGIAAAVALSAAAPFLYLRLIKARHHHLMFGTRDPPPAWFESGWIAAAALLPLAAAALPPGARGTHAAAALGAVVALWTAAAVPAPRPVASPLMRAWQALVLLWFPALVWGLAINGMSPLYQAQFSWVALALGFVWWRGQHSLIARLEQWDSTGRLLIGAGAVVLVVIVAAAAGAGLSTEMRPYVAALTIAACAPALLLLWASAPEANKAALLAGWGALFMLWTAVSERPVRPSDLVPFPVPAREEPRPGWIPLTPAAPVESPDYCQEGRDDPETCIWRSADEPASAPSLSDAQRRVLERYAADKGLPPIRDNPPRTAPAPPPPVQRPQPVRCGPDRRSGGPLPPAACGGMRNWIVAADYPPEAARRGEGGTSRVLLSVGSDGRVAGCRLDRSSGSAALDAATCRLTRARLRFHPARDSAGEAAPGEMLFSMEWQSRR
jgi:TonB family protein